MSYILNTPDDVRQMLEAVGVDSLDDLFRVVPEGVRLDRPLRIPPALPETALTVHLGEIARRNRGCEDLPCFLGGGAYDHFIPAAVDQLAGRSEFYTSYTPYQAEASQGTLQAIFEFQTLMTQLTGMDVSNASLYDGGSAVAEAVLMALNITGRTGRVVVGTTVHPEYRRIASTYLANLSTEIVSVPGADGRLDPAALADALSDDTAAVVLQYPNFFGVLEDVEELVEVTHRRGALAIVSVDPVSLGLLRRPSAYGADIVVAEGQSLGSPLAYGGPYLGILACRAEYTKKMPGRIVGQTTDGQGRRCWVLTLQTREQHIRREKATSNICTNQGLYALRASIYLALLGPSGLRKAAELSARKAHGLRDRLVEIPGIRPATDGPFFKEFAIRCAGDTAAILAEVERRGFHGGIALGTWYPESQDAILLAVTEKRTEAEISGLVDAYRSAMATSR